MQLINHRKSPAGRRSKSPTVFIREGLYTIKNITNDKEKIMAYKLRHKVFSQELGWVPHSSSSLEMDNYDENAAFLGVFDRNKKLKAFLRIVTPRNTFMLEKEFPYLLSPGHKVRKERDTIEISRLCVAPEARNEKFSGNFGIHSISMMLHKGVYHWCQKNGIRYLYLVVEEKVYRLLCAKGFPCKLVGQSVVMPDGVIAVAAIMDLREFEEINMIKRPKMFAWFKQDQLSQLLTRLPQHESCLPHQALS